MGGIVADDFALLVDRRAAGAAGTDCGIGLDQRHATVILIFRGYAAGVDRHLQ